MKASEKRFRKYYRRERHLYLSIGMTVQHKAPFPPIPKIPLLGHYPYCEVGD